MAYNQLMARMMGWRDELSDSDLAGRLMYAAMLDIAYPVSRQLVTTTPYPVGRMYHPPGSPEPVTDMVFNSGDTVTVTWTELRELTDDGTRTWVSSSTETGLHVRDLFPSVEGFTSDELEDEPYPCQLCWAAARWPWEPLRGCPCFVDVELTYCSQHRP